MELKLRIVALQSFHFYQTGFFQIVQSQFLTLEFSHVLNDFCQCIYDINQIVPLIEHYIYLLCCFTELRLETTSDNIQHEVRVGLITHLKDIVFANIPKSCMSGLQIVEGIPHITFCCEDNGFKSIRGVPDIFRLNDSFQSLQYLLIIQLCKSHNSTS